MPAGHPLAAGREKHGAVWVDEESRECTSVTEPRRAWRATRRANVRCSAVAYRKLRRA